MPAIERPALILTRPEPAARAFARAARAAGHGGAAIFSPVLRIAPVAPADIPAGTLVFTSEHGARRAAALGLAPRAAWAVGARTASVATALGFDCRTGPGTAAALAAELADAPGPFVHLHGRHVTGDLAGRLRDAGLTAHARTVYDQEARPLTAAARRHLARGPAILPLFSPRSATLAARGAEGIGPGVAIVAMSPAVADAWSGGGEIHVADSPDAAAMLACVGGLVARQRER